MDNLFITCSALSDLLPTPDAPVLLDLRTPEDACADPWRLPAAQHLTFAQIEAGEGSTGPCVCVCQKGGKLSQLAAGLLRARGVRVQVLRGGHLAWRDAGLPLVHAAPLAARWVMPLDPTAAELIALWLLRRYIDRSAPVVAVERAWMHAALPVWGAEALPDSPEVLAQQAGLDPNVLPSFPSLPVALIRGRLARAPLPEEALDLLDDCLAGGVAA